MYSIDPAVFERLLIKWKKETRILSVDELYEYLESGSLPCRPCTVITFDDALENVYTTAYPLLKKNGIPATIFVPTGLIGKSMKTNEGGKKVMSLDQLKELSTNENITLASHCHTHTSLTSFNEYDVEVEFVDSNRILAGIGVDFRYICYPNGATNKSIQKVASRYYKLGFGSVGTISAIEGVNMMGVPRIIVSKKTPPWKLALMRSRFYWILKRIRDHVF